MELHVDAYRLIQSDINLVSTAKPFGMTKQITTYDDLCFCIQRAYISRNNLRALHSTRENLVNKATFITTVRHGALETMGTCAPRSREAVYANNPVHTHGTMRQTRGFVSAVRNVIVDNVKRGGARLRDVCVPSIAIITHVT